jgi:hypothetical protein
LNPVFGTKNDQMKQRFKKVTTLEEIKEGDIYHALFQDGLFITGEIGPITVDGYGRTLYHFNTTENLSIKGTRGFVSVKTITKGDMQNRLEGGSLQLYTRKKTKSLYARKNFFTNDWVVGDTFYHLASNGNCNYGTEMEVQCHDGDRFSISANNSYTIYNFIDIARKPLTKGEKKKFAALKQEYYDCADNLIKRDLTFRNPLNHTHPSWVNIGYIENDGGYECIYRQSCIGASKTNLPLTTWIPVQYTNYHGYSIETIQKYTQFLNDMFGFECYKYEEHGEFGEPWQKQRNMFREYSGYTCDPILYHKNAPIKKNDFYKFTITPEDRPFGTYLRYIMLRYLHDEYYSFIPRTCLELRENLPTEITNWEIMLMSLSRYYVEPYYNLTTGRIPKITQLMGDVIERAQAKQKMNMAFEYTAEVPGWLEKLWRKKEYLRIYNEIKAISL